MNIKDVYPGLEVLSEQNDAVGTVSKISLDTSKPKVWVNWTSGPIKGQTLWIYPENIEPLPKKERVHKDLIKAWADGAEIEYYSEAVNKWFTTSVPAWASNIHYRIKPEQKPDTEVFYEYREEGFGHPFKNPAHITLNENSLGVIKLTICGETSTIKSVEILK